MLNGLDLFSGFGGITLALQEWVRPIAYCEIEKYCQGILLSRMDMGEIEQGPIWDDVQTLRAEYLQEVPDIIYGGFPCQDLSVAGNGKGLAGKRSGLFYEILRLSKEIRPKFIFLENVPGIRKKALHTVVWELANIGYDCRWCTVSAAQVGAPHKRNRWFLLAYSASHDGRRDLCKLSKKNEGEQEPQKQYKNKAITFRDAGEKPTILANPQRGLPGRDWWKTEPDVGRVVDGCAFRMDRIKSLGNGVVPAQVKTAFEYLMGINPR